MIEGLLGGLGSVFQPIHLLMLFCGIFLGFLGGAIPGISGTMLVIILLPLSYGLDPGSAFLLLTAIYATSVFSGSISAILFRTPGAPEAVATVFDGYTMAQKGQPGKALGISIFSSAIGGVIGTIILIFLTPLLASIALEFASPEYFALALLALTVVASLSGGNVVKGLIGVLFGLFIATIGIDPISGASRFTFGSNSLMAGLDFIPILIGLFAISEVLRKAQENHSLGQLIKKISTRLPEKKVVKKIRSIIGRSSILGVFIGILPGVGATTASMLSYSANVRWSKNPKQYGKGIPEGIAAPESANNSAAMGAMVPLLALGIPGSATTAVLLGAFILHGIQPGPLLFTNETTLVYTIFAGLLLANIAIILLAKPFIKGFSQIAKVPYYIIGPLIIIFCMIGSYAVRNSMLDVWVMVGFGILGYLLEKADFPLAPIVLGVVLGPLTEEQFRRSLRMSNGDFSIFFTQPISAVLLALCLLSVLFPIINNFRKRRKMASSIDPDETISQ